MQKCDVLVIGAGPGGLAAAFAAKKEGAKRVIVLERDKKAGGILNQCIHDGFGLIRYRNMLTGPEYAHKAIEETVSAGAEIYVSHHVNCVKPVGNGYIIQAYTVNGIKEYYAKKIIFATGCRERTRGNISIPGSRPAGIFTAGVAQNLINIHNVMIGKRVVILGSGDIGLIMARRLTLEGAEVLAVAEIMSEPTGLARNVSQCVYEFNIPLYVKTTVSRIIGKQKLEAVELAQLDENGKIIPGTARQIACDALVLSVGLIPENEVAQSIGVLLLPNNSVSTDRHLQTSVEGIFSCGNSRHVMDLADYVSEQGELAGRNAVHQMNNEMMEVWDETKSNCMRKGFPEKGSVTCSLCPNGCQVFVNELSGIATGNKCGRGETFAKQELDKPMRTITTTIRNFALNGKLVPIKTADAIEKEMVNKVVNDIKNIKLNRKCAIGESICSIDVNGIEIDVVATASM